MTLRKRRKKKPSSEPWLRTKVSGILRKGTSQLSQPPGKGGVGNLQDHEHVDGGIRAGRRAYSGALRLGMVRGA